jgi:hypothetical protein
VSGLIRNLLEDAFQLVDGVVSDVDRIVADSVSLARNVGARARRLGRGGPGARVRGAALAPVYAWSEAVPRRRAACAGCGAALERGRRAWVGLSDAPGPRAWLCGTCLRRLEGDAEGGA